MAALTSRSRTEKHLGQVHDLSFSVSSLLMYPQQEQVLLLGSKRPILRMFLPYHSALYSNIVTNMLQPESSIDLFNPDLADCPLERYFPSSSFFGLHLADIPLMFKSSIAILSWFLISSLEVLCKKYSRWLATFSCKIDNLFFVLLPLYFENLRCTYFSLDCALRKNLGLSNFCPSEATKYVLIPKSTPIVVFSLIFAFGLTVSPVSQSIEAKYLPVGVLLIVACLITPLISLCRIIFIPSLNLRMINLFSLIETFCGTLKDCLAVFFLNLGKSFCPLKNLVKAVSKLSKATCKDWLLTSFNQTNSFLRSGNCFCKSKQDRLTLFPAYAVCLHSKAKLYTNRQLPICLFISSACDFVGEILYLKAFSIKVNVQLLYQKNNLFKNLILTSALYPLSKDDWLYDLKLS